MQISSLLEDGVLTGRLGELRERLTSLVEGRYNNSTLSTQIADLTKRVTLLLEEGQRSVSPRVSNLQETLNATIGEFQEILDLIAEYDWDFDNYLTEDVPAAVKCLLLFSGKFLFICVNSGLFLELILLAVPAFICISRGFILVDSTSEPPFSLKHLHKHLCCSTWFSGFYLSLGAKYACRWIMC
jgi:hypothetical protein